MGKKAAPFSPSASVACRSPDLWRPSRRSACAASEIPCGTPGGATTEPPEGYAAGGVGGERAEAAASRKSEDRHGLAKRKKFRQMIFTSRRSVGFFFGSESLHIYFRAHLVNAHALVFRACLCSRGGCSVGERVVGGRAWHTLRTHRHANATQCNATQSTCSKLKVQATYLLSGAARLPSRWEQRRAKG